MSRDRRLVGGVHAFREGAQVVVEEPGVDVEGHRCRGVAEHPLDRLDVGATGHQQARGGVPEVIGSWGLTVVAGAISLAANGDCRRQAGRRLSGCWRGRQPAPRGHRFAPRSLMRHGGVDVERRPDDEAAAGRQGVPVVLPVREGSPGGSYGNGGRGARLCPALFPVEVPLVRRRHVAREGVRWPRLTVGLRVLR